MRHRSLATTLVIALLIVGATHATADPDPDPTEFEWRTDEHIATGKPAFGNENSPLRPGSDLGPPGYCTFNFVFFDPTTDGDPPVYIGTAGHCTERIGQRVTLGTAQEIGTVVYDSDLTNSDVDFSLIRVDRSMVARTNPKVLGWGGPRGIVGTSGLNRGDQVDVHGNGMLVGDSATTRTRWGLLVDWDKDQYAADMPAVNGDSGGPLIHDRTGKALGIVSHYGTTGVPPTTDAGPLMSWIFRAVSDAGFNDIVLATAQ
jgi:hypothetical protein